MLSHKISVIMLFQKRLFVVNPKYVSVLNGYELSKCILQLTVYDHLQVLVNKPELRITRIFKRSIMFYRLVMILNSVKKTCTQLTRKGESEVNSKTNMTFP